MENSIVRDFQNLQVLAAYDFEKMDELVQDLTNALEESSKSRNGETAAMHVAQVMRRHCKKRRNKKRRSNPNLWSKHGTISEASESSLDEALKDYMENVAQQSDSDDLAMARRLSSMSFPNVTQTLSLAESDSFTENFSPMRPHRRRRKFKRMAIDPEPEVDLMADGHHKRNRWKGKLRQDENQCQLGKDSDGVEHCTSQFTGEIVPGKRKRGGRGSSFDMDLGPQDGQAADTSAVNKTDNAQGDSSSSYCSSESDVGIYTNDEGRDGDDEQSDFFHEPGPACGIPGIIPWWEKDPVGEEERTEQAKFEHILKGSFEFLSPSAQRSFKARVSKLMGKRGREIRSGRRRLKDRDRQQRPENTCNIFSAWQNGNGTNGANQSGTIKRIRRTPPASPINEGFVGENASPIPEDNIGNQMLQQMGWTPGSGLGADSEGITTPVMACMRPRRQGLGAESKS